VQIPLFNFKTGKREWHDHYMKLSTTSVIIVEGLHALNPVMIPETLDKELVFKLYASPLLPLNLDDHNRIPTSYLRLLRRTVRDFEGRGASVQQTLSMWDSVRRGEQRWIFPYQEEADVIFNTSTLYELAVIKKHIYPLLTAVGPEEACYEQVRGMVEVLNFVLEADVDDEIPPTSLVREFIGGNTFYQ
jgi:uridine kinase